MTFRILAVTSYYKPAYVYGGPVRSTSALFEAMAHQGVHIDVYTTDACGTKSLDVPLRTPVDVNGVRVWYYPLSRRPGFYSRELGKAVMQNVAHYDLVHVEGIWNYNFIVASNTCLSQPEKKPYVVALRGQLMPWSLTQKKIKKRIYFELFVRRRLEHASGIYCTGNEESQAVSAVGLHTPTIIVPNGLDLHKFQPLPPKNELRAKFHIPKEALVLLFVGRLHRKKRPDIALDVHAELQKRMQRPIHLIIVGPDEGKMIDILKQRALKHGTNNEVHFTGLLSSDEIVAAYAAADLVLMPSEPMSENFGMVAVEAMAAGVPVLVTESIPSGMWAQDANAGMVSACSVPAFTEKAMQILQDTTLRTAMGRNGIALVKTKFEQSVVACQVIKQYLTLVEQK